MKDKLDRIFNHFGSKTQMKKLNEECYELIEALNEGNIEHIKEEMADVLVVIRQFKNYLGISNEELKELQAQKIDRTIKRIEEGYYK